MTFTSPIFIFVFLPICLFLYYTSRTELKNIVLVLCSLAFYSWGEPRLVWLLMLSVLVNYAFGRILERTKERLIAKRCVLVVSLLWNVGTLFYFKYLMFTLETVQAITGHTFSIPDIALPLGISFFTFRTISYVIDVYWEIVPPQRNVIDLALYVTFFPQVTMGPITKYSVFEAQLRDRSFDLDVFSEGAKRFVLGLAKKLILSDGVGVMVDHAFTCSDSERTVVLAWLGIIGYLLQLYYDFSGYSDMAIGLGKMFGFSTPENFNYPYASKTIVDFWNRWHTTLGSWLRDYIYTPVFRTNMLKKKHSVFLCDIMGLFVVWMIAGIWHGADWLYVVYGMYYFVFIALERTKDYFQKQRRKRLKLKKQPETRAQAALSHVYFFIVLIFGQLLFRIGSLGNYLPYVKSMFGLNGNSFTDAFSSLMVIDHLVLFAVGILFCFPVAVHVKKFMQARVITDTIYRVVTPVLYLALMLVGVSMMLFSTYNPFLYLNF